MHGGKKTRLLLAVACAAKVVFEFGAYPVLF